MTIAYTFEKGLLSAFRIDRSTGEVRVNTNLEIAGEAVYNVSRFSA